MAVPEQDSSTYFVDAENVAEMARLTVQSELVTDAMGGIFPSSVQTSKVQRVLDIACGSGSWLLKMARQYPHIQGVGGDISQLMIRYATAQAQQQGLRNAAFQMLNALKPLEFSDASFDFVNARFLVGFMLPSAWPSLLQESVRVTKRGGFIRLTESEQPLTNSYALEKLTHMTPQALKRVGQSYSPDGCSTGITPMLGHFLRDAGCNNVQLEAFAIDFSYGTKAYASLYQNYATSFKLVQPFLIKAGVTTQEEVREIYGQALQEMQSPHFCGIWSYVSAWGERI